MIQSSILRAIHGLEGVQLRLIPQSFIVHPDNESKVHLIESSRGSGVLIIFGHGSRILARCTGHRRGTTDRRHPTRRCLSPRRTCETVPHRAAHRAARWDSLDLRCQHWMPDALPGDYPPVGSCQVLIVQGSVVRRSWLLQAEHEHHRTCTLDLRDSLGT